MPEITDTASAMSWLTEMRKDTDDTDLRQELDALLDVIEKMASEVTGLGEDLVKMGNAFDDIKYIIDNL